VTLNGLVVPWKEYKRDFSVIAVKYDDFGKGASLVIWRWGCWLLRRKEVLEEGWQLV
jgi:hypothetical protein